MALTTPKHRASLWVLANVSWIAVLPAAVLYFYRQLLSGAYPVDADSIGFPIAGIAMWVVALLLPLNLVWFLLLRRYPGQVPLLASVKAVPTGAQILGILGIIGAVLCLGAAALAISENAWEITPVLFAWCYITLAMRAAHLATVRQASVEQ